MIGSPDELRVVAHLIALQQTAAGEHQPAFVVLGKEMHVGDMIEKRLKMPFRLQVRHPLGPARFPVANLPGGAGGNMHRTQG